MGIIAELSNGVIVAVVSTLVIMLLGYIYRTSILSFIKKITHNGVDISGSWTQRQAYTSTDENIEYDKTLIIQKSGSKVKGRWVFSKYLDGTKVDESKMTASGIILEGFVIINVCSASQKNVSLGTMLLKISSGSDLIDHYTFRNTNPEFSEDIASLPIHLKKEPA